MSKIKTIRKWEKKYNIKLEWVNVPGWKVENVRFEICKEYETQIMSCKKFNDSWIKGSKNPTSGAVKKHVTSKMHKRAADLALKKRLGLKRYSKIRPSESQLQKWIKKKE